MRSPPVDREKQNALVIVLQRPVGMDNDFFF